jgi:large subunit ribosomal protein L25
MKTKSISAQPRTNLSKAATKQLRREGKVPAILYGASGTNSIQLDYSDAKTILFTPETYIVQLDVDGNSNNTVVREAQYHPVTDKIVHIDFLEVSDDKAVEVVLPLVMVGTPKGVITGGRLMQKLRKLKVKGIPSELPDSIEVNVSDLELGSSIKVSDLDTGLHITSGGSAAIASVEIPRALRSAGAAGEGEEGEEDEEGAEE